MEPSSWNASFGYSGTVLSDLRAHALCGPRSGRYQHRS